MYSLIVLTHKPFRSTALQAPVTCPWFSLLLWPLTGDLLSSLSQRDFIFAQTTNKLFAGMLMRRKRGREIALRNTCYLNSWSGRPWQCKNQNVSRLKKKLERVHRERTRFKVIFTMSSSGAPVRVNSGTAKTLISYADFLLVQKGKANAMIVTVSG